MEASRTLEGLKLRFAPALSTVTPWLSGTPPVMGFSHLVLELVLNFLPVTYVLLLPKLGLSYSQMGGVALAMSISGTLGQPLFGVLADRRDARWIVVGSIAWAGLLMGLAGFVPSYTWLLAIVLLAAIGSAAFHPSGASLTTSAVDQNRGRSMSIFSVGGNLGSALSPVLVGVALALFGLPGTAIVMPIALLTSAGLLLYFRRHPSTSRSATGRVDNPALAARRGSVAALAAVIVVVAARSWFQMSLMTYLPQWLQSNGQPIAVAGAALSILLIAVSTGSLLGGSISDRFGRVPVIAVSLIMLVIGQLLLLNLTGPSQLAAIVLIGLMIGASFPVSIVLAQEAWPNHVGLASALVMGLGWLPAGIGAFVVGRIADQTTLTVGLQSLVFVPLVGFAAIGAYALLEWWSARDVQAAA